MPSVSSTCMTMAKAPWQSDGQRPKCVFCSPRLTELGDDAHGGKPSNKNESRKYCVCSRTMKYNIGATTYLFDNIGKPSSPLQQFPCQTKRSHAQSLPLEPSQKLTQPPRVPTACDVRVIPNFRQASAASAKPVQLLRIANWPPSSLPVELTGPQQAKSEILTRSTAMPFITASAEVIVRSC